MSALADSVPITGTTEATDRRRRIIAIIGASSGNLVEWYDFYAYAFYLDLFCVRIFSERRSYQSAVGHRRHFRRGLLHAASRRVAIRLDRRHPWPAYVDGDLGTHDVRRFAHDCVYAHLRDDWRDGILQLYGAQSFKISNSIQMRTLSAFWR
jgi:hypothetical protein